MANSIQQLGFADEQEGWLLTNRFFPSKIGGRPAWLELENIPDPKELLCDYCNEPCVFLCQIYAGSAHITHAFHRTIFVFICKKGQCCILNEAGNIKVVRSQLPLANPFYPDTPSDERIKSDEITANVKLCILCGCRGPMICGKCKKVSYCGQLHQKFDWKTHKKNCGIEVVETFLQSESNELLFPEFEIVIEDEEHEQQKKLESEKEAETRRKREYEELVKAGQVGTMCSDVDLKDFEDSKEDKTFGKFKKAIECYETQIIRYNRHGLPLWISDYNRLNHSSVPMCLNCGGRRTFEFQIMPQMLNELKNYELDWGIIAIYSCAKDCDVKRKYIPEFCTKQDITKTEENDGIEIEKLTLSPSTSSNLTQSTDDSKKLLKKNGATLEISSNKKTFDDKDEWE